MIRYDYVKLFAGNDILAQIDTTEAVVCSINEFGIGSCKMPANGPCHNMVMVFVCPVYTHNSVNA